MTRKIPIPGLIGLAVLFAALPLVSCNRSNTNSTTSRTEPMTEASPSPTKTGFESDLDYVRKGQYTYVLVFSRKDGKPLDKNDGAYLRTNAPQVVDWVTTDQG